MEHSEIIKKAKNLKQLIDSLNADIIADKPKSNLVNRYKELLDLKKSIKRSLITTPGIAFDEEQYNENEKYLKLIQTVSLDKNLSVERKVVSKLLEQFFERHKNLPKKDYDTTKEFIEDLSTEAKNELDFLFFKDDLTPEEERELAEEFFDTIYFGESYIRDLYNCGILIARIGSLPEFLKDFINEVRECFAFEKYLAVCALCRTILEISIRDLYNLEGFNDKKSQEHAIAEGYFSKKKKGSKWKYAEDYNISLHDMTNVLCKLPEYENFRQEIRDLKTEMNRVIHGNKTSNREESKNMIKRTLELIHNLYDV